MATGTTARSSECKGRCGSAVNCSTCLDVGITSKANSFCKECDGHFCSVCLRNHNSFSLLKSHTVSEVLDSDIVDSDSCSQEERHSAKRPSCPKHNGQRLESYCTTHDDLCCKTCVVTKHRECCTVDIRVAANTFITNADDEACKELLETVVVSLNDEKDKRTVHIARLEEQKVTMCDRVDQYEEETIAKVKQLAESSKKLIQSHYEETKSSMSTDVDDLDVVITAASASVDKLRVTDDVERFVNSKASKPLVEDCEKLIEAISVDWKAKYMHFVFDQGYETAMKRLQSFGQVQYTTMEDILQTCLKYGRLVHELEREITEQT